MSDANVYGMIFGGIFMFGILLDLFLEYIKRKK